MFGHCNKRQRNRTFKTKGFSVITQFNGKPPGVAKAVPRRKGLRHLPSGCPAVLVKQFLPNGLRSLVKLLPSSRYFCQQEGDKEHVLSTREAGNCINLKKLSLRNGGRMNIQRQLANSERTFFVAYHCTEKF